MTSDLTGNHILSRFDGDLGEYRSLVLDMGNRVHAQVIYAAQALVACDIKVSRRVTAGSKLVRELDLKAQEINMKVFALHQPVARDLRYILTLFRTVEDLARANAEAVKIAKLVESHYEHNLQLADCEIFDDLVRMSAPAAGMLARSISALGDESLEAAIAVIHEEDQLDSLFQGAVRRLATYIMEDPRNMRLIIDATLALKAMERVGDLAANIAQNAIFAISGKDVRYASQLNLDAAFLESQTSASDLK